LGRPDQRRQIQSDATGNFGHHDDRDFCWPCGGKNQTTTNQPNKLITIGMWVVFAYLVLNTLGNFASGVSAETWFFGPLTIVMVLSALRLAIEK